MPRTHTDPSRSSSPREKRRESREDHRLSLIAILAPVCAVALAQVAMAQNFSALGWGSDQYGVVVEREKRKGNSWGDLATFVVGPGDVGMSDAVGKKGRHRYRVQAFNGSGESAWSDWATAHLNS